MELFKDAGRQFAAGGCAGLVEVSLMHPLDLIKTRFQIQRGPEDLTRYKSLADCFRTIYRTEGFLSFYKGILPPILAETPKRATKFLTFEQYKRAFSHFDLGQPLTFSLAGFCCGLTEGVVICPFEVVKIRLQAERNVRLEQQQSTIQTVKEIFRVGGFGGEGLYRGLTSTLGRHGIWNMIYFGLYHSIKERFPPSQESSGLNLSYRFLLGLVAGTLASIANIPFDVAKSRIQGPQPSSQRKYHACFQTISLVYREEGFAALYKGLVPKIMRLGPGGAIMLIVYEFVYDFLKQN